MSKALTNDFETGRDQMYMYYLRILMSNVSEDGFVGPASLNLSHRRRLTHQFISALLACGFQNNTPILNRSLQWLLDSKDADPAGISKDDFYVVPDKIEAAMEMGQALEDFCSQAMQLLLKRRRSPMEYVIPHETPNYFYALWVTKIMLQHPKVEDYKNIIEETLNEFVAAHKTLRARDLSLLIALRAKYWPQESTKSGLLKEMVVSLANWCREGLFERV